MKDLRCRVHILGTEPFYIVEWYKEWYNTHHQQTTRQTQVLSHDQDTIHAKKGVCGNVWFPHGCLDVSYRSWDKSKNPCLCGTHTFPSSVHHQNLKSTQTAASYFPRPDDAPRWEMWDFHTGMGSCYMISQGHQDMNALISMIFAALTPGSLHVMGHTAENIPQTDRFLHSNTWLSNVVFFWQRHYSDIWAELTLNT